MGYTVLYIAFGVVALWLLAEVLYQHKARLRWRVLALVGFLGVAGGVVASQVVLIVAGALAFGSGQTLVTLSHRKGFSAGWALGGRPGISRRRRGEDEAEDGPPADAAGDEPFTDEAAPHTEDRETGQTAVFDAFGTTDDQPYGADGSYAADPYGTAQPDPYGGEQSGVYAGQPEAYGTFGGQQGAGHYGTEDDPYVPAAAFADTSGQGAAPVYSPAPLPDDTGEYGLYGDGSGYGAQPYAAHHDTGGHGGGGYPGDSYGNGWQPVTPEDDVFANGAPGGDPSYGGQWQQGQPAQAPYAPYAADPHAAGGYPSDPYAQAAAGQPGHPQDPYGNPGWVQPGWSQPGWDQGAQTQQAAYGDGGYPQDPYQQQSYGYDPNAWNGTPDGTQPHVPQQGAPGHDEQGAADPYQQPYQPYQQYQGYGNGY